jgi:mono/diheme cytochrome c family protein
MNRKGTKVKVSLVISLLVISITLVSFTRVRQQQKTDWVAPASADTIKNPLKGKAETIPSGKKIYATYCVACHGDKGKGDGIAASGLNPRPANHSSAKVQNQSDGAIFWKLTKGRTPMAAYDKILTVQQRWEVINYIRTLKAPANK